MTIFDQKFEAPSETTVNLAGAIQKKNFDGTLEREQYIALANGITDVLEAVGQPNLLKELRAITPGVRNEAVLTLPGKFDTTVRVESKLVPVIDDGKLLPGKVDTQFILTTTREDSAIMSFSAHLVQEEASRRPKSLVVNIISSEGTRMTLNRFRFTTILLNGDDMMIHAKTTILHGGDVKHPAFLSNLNDLTLENAVQILGEITTSLLQKPQK